MRKRTRLWLECLEERCNPSPLGQPWPDAGHLTVSFAPDGTSVNGAPSNLFKTLDQLAPPAQWQQVILKALQTWAVNTNLNVGLVADDGTAFGSDGAVQGDSRFGDLRIGMAALPANLVATTAPFSWTGSTWSGDVIFNSSYAFSLDGTGGYDLFTVALHEAGHALGIPSNDTDPQSIMAASYTGPRTGLDALDVANIQALYGAPTPAAVPNNTRATATPLGNTPAQLGFNADLAAPGDANYYRITTPLLSLLGLGTASVTISINSAGTSLLVPKLSVYDAAGRLVAAQTAVDPFDNTVSVTLHHVAPLTNYTFAVSGGTSDVFGMGEYSAQVSYQYLLSSIVGIVPSLVPGVVNTVEHLGGDLTSALLLNSPFGDSSDQRFNYLFQANLVYGGDTDYYKFTAPAGNGPLALDAIVWQTTPGGLAPALHLFDANGNPLAAQVLADSASVYSIQVLHAQPGQVFYVEVAGQTNSGPHSAGGYTFGIKFNGQPETVAPPLGAGTLPTAGSTDTGTLMMNQNGVFYFELAAANGGNPGAATVTLKVEDSQGHAVASLSALTGLPPRTAAIYLPAGTYSIVYAVSATNGAYQPATYWLSGEILSDPIGPYYSGSNPPPDSTSSSTTSGSSGSTTSATTTFTSAGASVSMSTPDGNTITVPLPASGGTTTEAYTTSVGTTNLTLTTDSSGNTTLILTTPSGNTITSTLTMSGDTSTQTLSTSDGIQVTLTTPATTSAPTYSGSGSGPPPLYYY